MGNLNENQKLGPKLSEKSFKKRLKKQFEGTNCAFVLDNFTRVVYLNDNSQSLFRQYQKNIQGFTIEQLSPKVQPHLGQASSSLIQYLANKSLNQINGNSPLNIIWYFMVQKNSQPHDTNKNPNDKYSKLGDTKLGIWTEAVVSALNVEESLYFEVVFNKIEPPTELLDKRLKILKFKKKIAKSQRAIKESQNRIQTSSFTHQTNRLQEQFKVKVSETNQKRDKFTKVKNELEDIQERLSERLTKESFDYSKFHERELKPTIDQLSYQEKKIAFQLKKLRSVKMTDSYRTKITTNYTRIEKKKEDSIHLRAETKRTIEKIEKNHLQIKGIRQRRINTLMESEKFQKQKNDIQNLIERIEYITKTTKDVKRRISNIILDKELENQISITKNRIKKITQYNNSTKIQLTRLKPRARSITSTDIQKHLKNSFSEGFDFSYTRRGDNNKSMGYFNVNPKMGFLNPDSSTKGKKRKKRTSSRRRTALRTKLTPRGKSSFLKNFENFNTKPSLSHNRRFSTSSKIHDLISRKGINTTKDPQSETDYSSESFTKIKTTKNLNKFDEFIKLLIGKEYYQEFLAERFKVEPLLLYFAIKAFKTFYNEKNGIDLSDYITQRFIMDDSLFQVELPDEIKKELNLKWETDQNSIDMFDKVEEVIYPLISEKYFKEFVGSFLYNELLDLNIKENEDIKKTTYRLGIFISEEKNTLALNSSFEFKGEIRLPCELIEDLMENLIDMLRANYSFSSETVNCHKLSRSIPFKRFKVSCSELTNIEFSKINNLMESAKKSFFINLYNVMFLHSIFTNKMPNDKSTFNHFLQNSKYILGGSLITLLDIRAGVFGIKSHKKPNVALLKKLGIYNIFNNDPRIHFTLLNCTSQPVLLSVYQSENMERQLEDATKYYLNNYLFIDYQKKSITLPILIDENSSDFASNNTQIIVWIRNHLKFTDPISLYSLSFKIPKSKISNLIIF
ncbi:electron carrier/ protein disulfide oxidoreductase [Anaeramoeba flamelloides]|uniref:Electron carrier/ protein disulfide oxidoreductase n=1 Tax=Anaeramoeba flamelloides TaxID=1746091 RepID=A0ABQ8X2N0_9EUKA|nr:electron carrier/ protein disulfide oxidoreductase [Anaeramoeba flamelloides]